MSTCAPPQSAGKASLLSRQTDQVPEPWERRLKGVGQVTPILQAAHVAAFLLDPAYATVDKDCASLPEMPAEHEQMSRDLLNRVGGAAAAREFEQLLLGGYADELKGPAAVCTDSSAATASVGSKRACTASIPIGSRKGFWRSSGKRRYPWPKWRCVCWQPTPHQRLLSATGRFGGVCTRLRAQRLVNSSLRR
jgi:hypothetical protein